MAGVAWRLATARREKCDSGNGDLAMPDGGSLSWHVGDGLGGGWQMRFGNGGFGE